MQATKAGEGDGSGGPGWWRGEQSQLSVVHVGESISALFWGNCEHLQSLLKWTLFCYTCKSSLFFWRCCFKSVICAWQKRLRRSEHARKETEFLRLKRTRLGLEDFESLKVIGRGAFGEVKYFLVITRNLIFFIIRVLEILEIQHVVLCIELWCISLENGILHTQTAGCEFPAVNRLKWLSCATVQRSNTSWSF